MENKEEIRIESDSMGEMQIPHWAYWGAQTQRAVENFGVSDKRLPLACIHAFGLVKKHAARVNAALGLLDGKLCDAIQTAAGEVQSGSWDEHFPIDVFQTGSGTSSNMNSNELIANRANEILGGKRGSRSPVHPNDHVNRGQSSNDVVPTVIHIANRIEVGKLIDSFDYVAQVIEEKEKEFSTCIKLGRTHLQDAVPMTLGQEFSAYRTQVLKAKERLQATLPRLEELALGGTAIGTGINCHPEFASKVIQGIASETGIAFRPADNRFEAMSSRDTQVELMGMLNTYATSLMKIANDLRILASGPRGALGEIVLPSLQPGSSIMPGKVNPVIPEMLIQVAAYVNGKSVSVTIAGQHAPLELNMMHPLIAHETMSSIDILRKSNYSFADKCLKGIVADTERLQYWIEWSLALVTPLALELGYDTATKLAYQAYNERKKIKDVVLESKLLSPEKIDELLDPSSMI